MISKKEWEKGKKNYSYKKYLIRNGILEGIILACLGYMFFFYIFLILPTLTLEMKLGALIGALTISCAILAINFGNAFLETIYELGKLDKNKKGD